MMRRAVLVLMPLAWLLGAEACTTIVASLGGTTFTTHTADCPDCDFRLAKVKRRVLPVEGSEEVMLYRRQYPREVSDRAATWASARVEGPTEEHVSFWRSEAFHEAQRAGSVSWKTLDEAARVAGGRGGGETSLAYYESLFAIANEAGVTMGESTCYARLSAGPARADARGFVGATYDIAALSRVALERCATARCAVALMGALAEAEGYYAAASAPSEAGEALTVADGAEGWMFHILPANTTDGARATAVWAAMRVNEGEASVCANAFVIRGVPAASGVGADGREYLVSTTLEAAAVHHGLPVARTADGDLDFYATYGGGSDPYNLKRQWRVYDRLAPSLHLPPDDVVMAALHERAAREGVVPDPDAMGATDEFPAGVFADLPQLWRDDVPKDAYYPVAVRIETVPSPLDAQAQVDAANVFASLMREIYSGTKFDASLDLRGGAFGDPEELPGGPRRISLQRTSFWHVGQSSLLQDRPLSTVLRYGQYAPHSGPVVPLFVAGDAEPPVELTTGNLYAAPVDLQQGAAGPVSLFWASALLGGWTRQYFRVAQPEVERRRDALERQNDADLLATLAHAEDLSDPSRMDDLLARSNDRASRRAVATWLDAFREMIVKYRDGYVVTDKCGPVDDLTAKCDACPVGNPSSTYDISVKSMTYLKWWEEVVDPEEFPPPNARGSRAAMQDDVLQTQASPVLIACVSFLAGGLAATFAAATLAAKRGGAQVAYAPAGAGSDSV